MKKLVICTLFLMQVFLAFAQSGTGFSGSVIDSKTKKPMQDVVVSVQNTALMQLTDSDGKFNFLNINEEGNQLISIKTDGYKEQILTVELKKGIVIDLGVIIIDEDQSIEAQTTLVTITDNDLNDDNNGSETTAGMLQSSRDAFQQSAAFYWGQARFKIRGLNTEYGTTMINGVSMNKELTGRPQWANWGGLNDATRNQEFTMGSAASDYTFGGILGTQEINTRASIYRSGSRISFAGTNTNYNWRMMGTHASGMGKNGWAYVVSAGKRLANNGYFEGTTYDANSFFASVEKKISDNHSLNLTAIYAKNSRGIYSPNTQEVSDLMGEKYNSYWGWQDGKKRNSRVKNILEPIFMLSHYWKINDNTKLNTNVTYQFGAVGTSRLNYQYANNPDPMYYKNLPSYWTSLYGADQGEFSGPLTPNQTEADITRLNFLSNAQLNWDAMYKANTNPVLDGNGNEIGRTPAQSKFILYEDRNDDKTWTANTILSSKLTDNIVLNGGATYRKLMSTNFSNLLDLLGGNGYLDINTFGANINQKQSDLLNSNRMVGVGDKFGYNYNLYSDNLNAFTQFKFIYKKVDFYLAQTFSSSVYQREGFYQNGYYPTNSLGRSAKTSFENFGFKGGATYKISGRQFLTFNGVRMTKAPSLRSTYPNSRLNNNTIDGLTSENISSVDASYVFSGPRFKARFTAYYSKITNSTQTSFFYADGVFANDDSTPVNDSNAFVDETLLNVSKKNIGAELGLEWQFTSTLKATAAAAFGQYTYDNNPDVLVSADSQATEDNTNPVRNFGQAMLKDYRQSGMPQQAYSVGLEYRDPKFWNIGANLNYLADNYLGITAITRTNNFFINPVTGFNFPEATVERGRELLKQEKFNPVALLNLNGGKSWKIGSKTFGFFASVNNVLDVTYKTGGYEQSRNANFRQLNQDVSSGTPAFGPKYFYGYGRTYFFNLYINF